jgi:hypothetical protein
VLVRSVGADWLVRFGVWVGPVAEVALHSVAANVGEQQRQRSTRLKQLAD